MIMGKKRISEIITIDEIKKWSKGSIVTIKAGTGSGKSYFIKNILYAFAKDSKKKILMLEHRTNCKNQFLEEIKRDKKLDIIDIVTYQTLENKDFDFNKYEYIVCDEFHYFMGDAAFNYTTDISLNKILSQKDKIKIFMSATGDAMKGYICNIKGYKSIDYELPINFDFIKRLKLFNKDETLANLIQESRNYADKAIVFIDSAKKAYELYKEFKDISLFNCSKSNKDYYKYVDEDKINKMLRNEKFDEKILITTTCLDAGVNIIDKMVKHIICDVKDFGSLVQCIGRKRRDVNEEIYLYIQNISNEQLGGMKGNCNKLLKEADYFVKNGDVEYVKKYGRVNTNLIYDEPSDVKYDKKLNEMMYYKLTLDSAEYDYIINYDKSYSKFLKRKFDVENKVVWLKEDNKGDELEWYLEENVGKVMLQVKDRQELIEKINVRRNGRLLKRINNLNGALEEGKLPYRIVEFSTSRILNGKKRNFNSAWRIEKLSSV